ncbi:MAG: signal recognition particle-docking protein FtsY [Gemmatimonadota bacterium]|nr:signal recognition particle-docking protein FtsY [Gemmatimonadota bacterium]
MARLFRKQDEKKKGIWQRIVDLALTDVRVVAKGVDQESLEQIEERLIAADFGVPATLALVDHVEQLFRRGKVRTVPQLEAALAVRVREILEEAPDSVLSAADTGPTVYLIVGVNGVGKTTSIAKLAARLRAEGRSVLLAAADTFRAGAVEQLRIWSGRVGAEFVAGQSGGDPAAVAFDGIEAAVARGIDVVLVDTAGRLHTHGGLMEELSKVDRVIRKRLPGAPHETLIVLDATLGQNSVRQVDAFRKVVDLSGIILAKADSSARGGIVVALAQEYGLPVKLVGTGEGIDDIQTFQVADFVEALVTA